MVMGPAGAGGGAGALVVVVVPSPPQPYKLTANNAVTAVAKTALIAEEDLPTKKERLN